MNMPTTPPVRNAMRMAGSRPSVAGGGRHADVGAHGQPHAEVADRTRRSRRRAAKKMERPIRMPKPPSAGSSSSTKNAMTAKTARVRNCRPRYAERPPGRPGRSFCMLSVPSPAASTWLRNIAPITSATAAMAPTTTTRAGCLRTGRQQSRHLYRRQRRARTYGPPVDGLSGPSRCVAHPPIPGARPTRKVGRRCDPPRTRMWAGVYHASSVRRRASGGRPHVVARRGGSAEGPRTWSARAGRGPGDLEVGDQPSQQCPRLDAVDVAAGGRPRGRPDALGADHHRSRSSRTMSTSTGPAPPAWQAVLAPTRRRAGLADGEPDLLDEVLVTGGAAGDGRRHQTDRADEGRVAGDRRR